MDKEKKEFFLKDYKRQKVFAECVLQYFVSKSEMLAEVFKNENNPLFILQQLEKEGEFKKAYSGVKMMVNDLLEWGSGLNSEEKDEINKILLDKKLPTFDQMSNKAVKKIRRFIIRGKILNDEEYYLIKNFLDDEDNRKNFNADEIERINSLIRNFEIKQ